MIVLAIDTTGAGSSVALEADGRTWFAEEAQGREQARTLPALVHGVLRSAGRAPADVGAIACAVGPGSFTSLRVGVAYAQGLALGLGCPAIAVSTLAMIANAAGPGRWIVAQDARMDEVYLGAYEVTANGVLGLLGAESVGPAHAAGLLPPGTWGRAGNAWSAYGPALHSALGLAAGCVHSSAVASARDALAIARHRLAQDGAGGDAAALQPNYLRERVALTLLEQRARTASD